MKGIIMSELLKNYYDRLKDYNILETEDGAFVGKSEDLHRYFTDEASERVKEHLTEQARETLAVIDEIDETTELTTDILAVKPCEMSASGVLVEKLKI